MNPGPRWAAHPTSQAPVLGDQDGGPTQGQDHRHRTGCARASRPGSNATASSRWSPGSAGYPSYATRTRSSPTASRTGFPTPQGAGHPAPREQVRAVRANRARCSCTRSASSPTSAQPGPAQPAWAAVMARKRRKTLVVCRPCHDAHPRTAPRHRSGVDHWRATCTERCPRGSEGGRAFARSSGELKGSRRELKGARGLRWDSILGFVLNPGRGRRGCAGVSWRRRCIEWRWSRRARRRWRGGAGRHRG